MIKALMLALTLSFMGAGLSGCVIVAAAGAGYFVADEVSEGDGKVDPLERAFDYENEGRLLVFKRGGKARMPAVKRRPAGTVSVGPGDARPDRVDEGRALYAEHCMRCHGMAVVSSGLYPDLRHATRATHERWNDIVLGGTLASGGMASFADVVDAEGARAIQAYVIERALHEPTLVQQLAAWASERFCIPSSWATD